jgi:hypothetical protein
LSVRGKKQNKITTTKKKPEQKTRFLCPKTAFFLEFLHLFSASQIRKLIPLSSLDHHGGASIILERV